MLTARKINQGSAPFRQRGFAEGGLTKHVLHVYTWRSRVRIIPLLFLMALGNTIRNDTYLVFFNPTGCCFLMRLLCLHQYCCRQNETIMTKTQTIIRQKQLGERRELIIRRFEPNSMFLSAASGLLPQERAV